MNYELVALAVTILAAMGAGFAWLSHQMKDVRDELKADIKDVRDELKTDIKRVEEKLDNHLVAVLRREMPKLEI